MARSPQQLANADGWSQRLKKIFAYRYALPSILFVALVLRAAHLAFLRQTIWWDTLDLDPRYFDEWGQRIAAGQWLGERMFFVDPLYPYFLGAIYKLFGHTYLLPRIVQMIVGVATVLLVARVGEKLKDKPSGNGAALLYAAYLPAIFNEAELEKTAFATFFCLLAIWLILQKSTRSILGAGLVLGLAALCRTNMLILAMPLGWYVLRENQQWLWSRAIALALGIVVAISPALLHNFTVGGEVALVTSAGQNFYQGNNPYNTGGGYDALPFIRGAPEFEETDFQSVAENNLQRKLTPGEVSEFWQKQAIDHILKHPRFAFTMLTRKFSLLLNDYEVPDNQDMYFLAQFSPVLQLPFPTWGWILPLAALGFLTFPNSREKKCIAAIVGLYAVSIAMFFVLARYRLPMAPLIALFAIFGGQWLLGSVLQKKWQAVGMSLLAVIAVSWLSFRDLSFHDKATNQAMSWHNLGALQIRAGHPEKAVEPLEKAAELAPQSPLVAAKLGLLHLQLEKLPEAEAALQRALSLDPALVSAWVGLGQVHEKAGRKDQAKYAFQKALDLNPHDQDALHGMARVLKSP